MKNARMVDRALDVFQCVVAAACVLSVMYVCFSLLIR